MGVPFQGPWVKSPSNKMLSALFSDWNCRHPLMPDEFVEAKAHRDLKLDTVTWDIWGYILWVFPKAKNSGTPKWMVIACV